MKKAISKRTKDPTLGEVFDFVKQGFASVEKRFGEVDERFDRVDERFGFVDKRFGALNERINSVDARLGVIERDLSKTKNLVLDVQEEVISLNVAIENDARRYFDHDQRIKRLEKTRA